MVTSALEQNSRIHSQGSDRQPSGATFPTEDHIVVQEQARDVTVRESRPKKIIRNMVFHRSGGRREHYDANGVINVTFEQEEPTLAHLCLPSVGNLAFRIANEPRRRRLPRDTTTELRDQIRAWEHDELKKMEQERKQSSLTAGEDGTQHHLDHLNKKTGGQNVDQNDQANQVLGTGDQNDQYDQTDQVLRLGDRVDGVCIE
jgi:hypothetical protein